MLELTPLLIWWFIITLFALVGWGLAFPLLRHLPDRGYSLARPVGFLLVGYIVWLGGSFRLLQNNLGGVIVALLTAAVIGLAWQRGDQLAVITWLKREWRYVVTVELFFHLALVSWTIFKAYNPNIEWVGGEKWMEIAFINGTLRSDYFPPQDPWLSGFGISYYYFGYIMMAMITRLTGLISTTAFNLYIPTLFAMTLVAAFGILANLVTLHRYFSRTTPPLSETDGADTSQLTSVPALTTGLIGALFVAVLGNLEGVLEVFHKRGLFSPDFWLWLDIRDLKVPPAGLSESWLPDRHIWWWRGSRVLTDYTLAGQEQEVIDEFPFFSFLLGDVHPHILALPFVLLVVALALNLLLTPRSLLPPRPTAPTIFDRGRQTLTQSYHQLITATGGRLGLIIYAIAVGGLSFLNTWDFPIYLSLVGLSFILWLTYQQNDWQAALLSGVVGTVILGILGILFYFPFYATFQSQAQGILPNLWNPTRLPHFLVFFGPFILASSGLLAVFSRRYQGWNRYIGQTLLITVLGPLLFLLLLFSLMLFTGNGQTYVQGILNNPEVRQVLGQSTVSALVQESLQRRLQHPGTFLLVGGLVGWGLALLFGDRLPRHQNTAGQTTPQFILENFVLILLFIGLGLALAVEFVYLRDNFGIRMNTVFKFYFQAWVLLGLVAAYSIYYVSSRGRGILVPLWQGAMALLVAGGLVYPVLAIGDKTNYFQNEPTLDGIHWVSQAQPDDHTAIEWLRANAKDEDIILEAPGAQGASYQYTGRISALTGLPTLLGWGGHQSQWRGNYDEPGRREPDIELLFNSPDINQMYELLDKYNIRYIYVGPLERERYNPQGLQKFGQALEMVFQQGQVTIYQTN